MAILNEITIYHPHQVDQALYDSTKHLTSLNSELDRFGFSSVLNFLVNGKYQQKNTFCNWIHGWKWFPPLCPEMLGITSLAVNNRFLRLKPVVVHSKAQFEHLFSLGFLNVVHGCLPYAYLDLLPPEITNFKPISVCRDILLIPPKSQIYQSSRQSFSTFIHYVNDTKSLRDSSVICIFADDITKESVRNLLASQSIPFLIGASPFDSFGLLRILNIFKAFKSVVTNTMGTHIPFAAKLGLPVTILESIYDERSADFLLQTWPKNLKPFPPSAYFEYLEYVHSLSYLLSQLNFLLSNRFWTGAHVSWGQAEILNGTIPLGKKLSNVLGWDLRSRTSAHILSALGRVSSLSRS